MRYRLRTLMILLAILPPILAVSWVKYAAWRSEQQRLELIELQTKSSLVAAQQELAQRALQRAERLVQARQIVIDAKLAADLAEADARAAPPLPKPEDQPPLIKAPEEPRE
jgi:hypothetical protein